MNQECHFLEEKSKIFAAFACLGKTNFSKKYPHLSRDLEISNFRCLFKSSEDIEGLEPTLEQDVNPHFPQNYLCAIGKNYGKKAIIFIALSPEIMRILDNLGVLYSVIYPEKNMAPETLKHTKDRGNNNDFIKLLRKNLSNNNELNRITSNTRPKRIIIAKNQDTIESILKNDHEIQNILPRNSSFTYKGVCYSVVFKSLINKRIPNKNWGQVYAVGRINNQVPIVKYNKKGFISFNLPGGGTESGESYEGAEETIRNYKIGHVITSPSQLSYAIAQVRVVPQTRLLQYIGETFYDAAGNVLWSKGGGSEKEMNSQQFDEEFYAAIVDMVFHQGEMNRLRADDRWILLWTDETVSGIKTQVTADTSTMRRTGDNLVFWAWTEVRDADGKAVEIKFDKRAVNLPQGTERIVTGRYWSPSDGWQPLDDGYEGAYRMIVREAPEGRGLIRLRAFADGYSTWVNRYQVR